jgi:hypothetical protein
MQAYLPIICDECRGELRLVTSVASFGGSPGARFFQCTGCGHLQIEDVSASVPPGAAGMDIRSEGA